MNRRIFEFFKSKDKVPNSILPHQIATLDYMIRACLYNHMNILVYHKMGSGKTVLGLIFGIILSKTEKILIILPNYNILKLWKDQLIMTLELLPLMLHNIDNIKFITRFQFIDRLSKYSSEVIKKIREYDNHYIIIDEAHNFFGNMGGENLHKINDSIRSKFILLTGSPISNTVKPIVDLIPLITRTNLPREPIVEGSAVYDVSLTRYGEDFVKKSLLDRISFYNQEESLIPRFKFYGKRYLNYPVLFCPMTRLQRTIYDQVRADMRKEEKKNSEMFYKTMIDVSLCAIGNLQHYRKFESLLNLNTELLPGLEMQSGILVGNELTDLNISSKLKYFRDKYVNNITRVKKFIYFLNSTFGSIIIRSVMIANGISEFRGDIVSNFRCVRCNMDRKCDICIPARFLIITSRTERDMTVNEYLEEFNHPSNDMGDNIMFLFGSKIMSEAYTLKEVMNIIFLTVPYTKGELFQVIYRALRSFSYKDLKSRVIIEILVATFDEPDTTNDFFSVGTLTLDDKVIQEYKELIKKDDDGDLNEDDDKSMSLPHDLRRIIYLVIKSGNSNTLIKILKKSHVDYEEPIIKELRLVVLYEIVKRYFYENTYLDCIDSIVTNDILDDAQELLDYIVNHRLVVHNKNIKNAFIMKVGSKNNIGYIIVPQRLTMPRYFMKLNFYDIITD